MDVVRNLQILSHEELMPYAAELEQKVLHFKQAEIELHQSYDQLETQAQTRIIEMERLNQALAHEVLERIEAEQSLLEEQRLLNILMDNVPDLIYFKDADSRFTRINRAHARMLGLEMPDDALGKSDADFQDSQLAATFITEEAQIIASGQPVVNREEFNPASDGTPRWYFTTKVPIQEVDGRITGIVGISRDVTKRKQAEIGLRNSEEQFHSTFTYAAIGMALVGLDGRWLQVNKAVCEIVGYSEAELMTKTFQDITHPDDLDSDLVFVGQLLAGEIQSYQMEKCYFHKFGHEVWVLLSVSLVRDSHGQPLHFISQIQNITERRQLQAALLDKEKLETVLSKELELSSLKTRMMKRIGHEFRTPLAIIQLSTETLTHYLDRLTPEQRQAKCINIGDQIRRITVMLDKISLVVNGSFTPDSIYRVSTDVSALCREIAVDLEAKSGLPNKYQLDLPETIWVRLDPNVLQNTIKQIMSNAARFSTPSADVSVRLLHFESAIELRVTNSGIGILPDELPHIFEPFFRGSDIGEVGGLGVGLTLARTAIEAHGGTISVESIVGQGTTVTIWLPV